MTDLADEVAAGARPTHLRFLARVAADLVTILTEHVPFTAGDDVTTEELMDLRLALKGDPRFEGDKGAVGALGDLARDLDTALADRMDLGVKLTALLWSHGGVLGLGGARRIKRGEVSTHDVRASGWKLDRHEGGAWRFDGARLLEEYLPRALERAGVDQDTGEIAYPEMLAVPGIVLHEIARAVAELVDVSRNARTTPIKDVFGDKDAPGKFGDREKGRPSVQVTWIGEG